MEKEYTWVISWDKIKDINDIKLLLQSFDLQVLNKAPGFKDLVRLCKMIDEDGNEVNPETNKRKNMEMNKILEEIDLYIEHFNIKNNPNESIYYILNIAKEEIKRLLRGDFSPDEFQNLCHNMTCEDRTNFEKGCLEYQNKLFGPQKLEYQEIPQDVYWNSDSQNFYNIKTKIGMGLEFYQKWYHRKHEFKFYDYPVGSGTNIDFVNKKIDIIGPQKQPFSVNQVEAQNKAVKKEYSSITGVTDYFKSEQYERELQKIKEGGRKIDE